MNHLRDGATVCHFRRKCKGRAIFFSVLLATLAGARITAVRGVEYIAPAVQDAYASNLGRTINDPELDIGYRQFLQGASLYRAAVKFDIPASILGKPIQSARLKLYYFDAWETFASQNVHVHRVTQAWTENALSYEVAHDASSAEATVGGKDFRWISWDVTSVVKFWSANPGANHGFLLDSPGVSNTVRLISREHETVALRPALEIRYEDRPPSQFTGTVSVQVDPEEAVAAGAQWRVAGGEWMNSGTVASNIPSGMSLVEFKTVDAWSTPASFPVRVVGNQLASGAGTYRRVAQVNLGEISTARVYGGEPIEFRLRKEGLPAGSALVINADTNRAGEVAFDASSGLFRYTPAAQDRERFNVTFTAVAGTNILSQVVPVEPVPKLAPERTVFGLAPGHPLPSEESKDYIVVNTILGESPEPWNNQNRTTRELTLSGKTIVLQKGHPNGLYDSYNGNEDIKKFNVHAETLIVRNAFSLPQSDVTIYARDLRFEGTEASINTTPRAITTRPAQFEAGVHGLKGGDITLHMERYTSDPPKPTRFVLSGGNGQPGGLGQDGKKGLDKSTCGGWNGCPWPNNTTAARFDVPFFIPGFGISFIPTYWRDEGYYNNPTAWQPENGGDAKAGGKPGNGGKGGSLYSTLNLPNFMSEGEFYISFMSDGGRPGEGSSNIGGQPGEPRPAYRSDSINGNWGIGVSFTSQPGKNATSPPPDLGSPLGGELVKTGHSLSWVSPYALRMVLAHAKDAYLYGYVEEAERILAPYEQVLSAYQQAQEWQSLEQSWQLQLSEMLSEIQTIRHRIGSHLDYFGNPAGWVPMLSFEANKAAYEKEVDGAIRVLYLSYWIGKAANTLQAKVDSLRMAKEKTIAEIEENKGLYSDATALIPALQAEAGDIEQEEKRRLEDIRFLEQKLLAQANSNVEDRHKVPEWKKAAGVLSVVCMAVPVYQPVLGAVGAGLKVLAESDPDDPMGTVVGLASLAGKFSDKAFAESAHNWKTNLDAIKLSVVATNGLQRYIEYARAMQPLAKPLGTNMAAIQRYLKEAEIPKNELEAELARLKAESPEFQEIAGKLKELAQRKDQFQYNLNVAIQSVSKLAAEITHDLLAVDAMNRGVADGNRVLDPRVAVYLKEMERRARERLLKYHYYVAKAYEYRLLRPYPGELNLTRLFDKMAALATASNNQTLSADDYNSLKAIYEEQLATVTSTIFNEYNSNRPELSTLVRFELTTNELAHINSGQPLTINMHEMGLFPQSEENIRIVKWRVASIQTHRVGGDIGRFGYMDLYMQHSGLSTLSHKGQFYLFRHNNQNTERPIQWGIRYDAADNTHSPIEPSVASESLLRSLLGAGKIPDTSENLLLYSRPAAWADIVLKKEVKTQSGADIVIDSLRLELQYDFIRRNPDQVGLEVAAAGADIQPLLTVSTPDINGRQDALGEMNRTYVKNSTVTLSAPEHYGVWRFDKWTDSSGNALDGGSATNSEITLRLADSKSIKAAYVAAEAPAGLTDTDEDGLTEEWENRYGLDPKNPKDASLDKDGDGVTNLEEFQRNTNPVDAGEYGEAPQHPADTNPSGGDWRLTIGEVVSYTAAYKRGQSWSRGENPIPPSYVARAGYLYKKGEQYQYLADAEHAKVPARWELRTGVTPQNVIRPTPQSLARAASADARLTRILPEAYEPGAPFEVSLQVTPPSGVTAYMVEDSPPEGWMVSGINEGGEHDVQIGRVKWGLFFDSQPRTLSYQVAPPAGATGIFQFSGLANFDGTLEVEIGGARLIGDHQPPRLYLVQTSPESPLRLRIEGWKGRQYEIQASSDLAHWTTAGNVTTDPSTGHAEYEDSSTLADQRYYRVRLMD